MNIDAGDYLASLDEILQKTTKPCFYMDKRISSFFPGMMKMGQQKALTVQNTEIKWRQNYWKRINGKSYLVHTDVNGQYDLFLVSLDICTGKDEWYPSGSRSFLLYSCLILLP